MAIYLWLKIYNQGLGGRLTAGSIQLAWHSDIHTWPGLAILAAGAVI